MNPNGSPDIVERGRATQFKRGDEAAVEAQKKSIKKRKQNRSMRQTMKLLAQTPMGPGKAFDLKKLKSLSELDDDGQNFPNLTADDIIALKIVKGAMEEDPECRRLYLELSGALEKEKSADTEGGVTVIVDV